MRRRRIASLLRLHLAALSAQREGGRPARAPVDPTACPSAASVRIAAYPTARNLVVGPPPAALPGAG